MKALSIIKKIFNHFRIKSPCCNEVMISCFEMELDTLLYECPKCCKQYI